MAGDRILMAATRCRWKAGRARNTELLSHPTQLALVGPRFRLTGTGRKDLILIQMSFHPSPERLFSRSLWGMCPPPQQPQTLPFRLGSQ